VDGHGLAAVGAIIDAAQVRVRLLAVLLELNPIVALARRLVFCSNGVWLEWELEASIQGFLDNGRCLLKLSLGVLLEDGTVVTMRLLAAFDHHGHKWSELTPSVARVMHMPLGLWQLLASSLQIEGFNITYPITLAQNQA
jgi:hypothetical protein